MIAPNIINIAPKPYRIFRVNACDFPSGVVSSISISKPSSDSIDIPAEIDMTPPIMKATPISSIIRLPVPLLIFYRLLPYLCEKHLKNNIPPNMKKAIAIKSMYFKFNIASLYNSAYSIFGIPTAFPSVKNKTPNINNTPIITNRHIIIFYHLFFNQNMPALSNLGREGRVSYTRNNILFYVFMGESVSSRGSRGLQIICFAAIIQDPSATLPSVATITFRFKKPHMVIAPNMTAIRTYVKPATKPCAFLFILSSSHLCSFYLLSLDSQGSPAKNSSLNYVSSNSQKIEERYLKLSDGFANASPNHHTSHLFYISLVVTKKQKTLPPSHNHIHRYTDYVAQIAFSNDILPTLKCLGILGGIL